MLHSAIFLGGGRGGEAEGRTWPTINPYLSTPVSCYFLNFMVKICKKDGILSWQVSASPRSLVPRICSGADSATQGVQYHQGNNPARSLTVLFTSYLRYYQAYDANPSWSRSDTAVPIKLSKISFAGLGRDEEDNNPSVLGCARNCWKTVWDKKNIFMLWLCGKWRKIFQFRLRKSWQ